jgi:predicted nucleotidyltransferase
MKEAMVDPVVEDFGVKVRAALGDNIEAVYWFGSRARGEGTADSDYDILIATRRRLTEEDRDSVADIAVDFSAKRGVLMDIHIRTSEAMVRDAERSPLIATVLRESVAA